MHSQIFYWILGRGGDYNCVIDFMMKASATKGIQMKIIISTLIALSILGCSTTYQSSGFTGGYSETQLDLNVFRVTFNGNAYTGRDKVADFTLLRSAELTLANGYKYFVIVDSENTVELSTHTTPITTNTTANAYGTGNHATVNATSTTSGGHSYTRSKPSSSNTIICFKEKPVDGFSYNAQFIVKSMTGKYKLTDT